MRRNPPPLRSLRPPRLTHPDNFRGTFPIKFPLFLRKVMRLGTTNSSERGRDSRRRPVIDGYPFTSVSRFFPLNSCISTQSSPPRNAFHFPVASLVNDALAKQVLGLDWTTLVSGTRIAGKEGGVNEDKEAETVFLFRFFPLEEFAGNCTYHRITGARFARISNSGSNSPTRKARFLAQLSRDKEPPLLLLCYQYKRHCT